MLEQLYSLSQAADAEAEQGSVGLMAENDPSRNRTRSEFETQSRAWWLTHEMQVPYFWSFYMATLLRRQKLPRGCCAASGVLRSAGWGTPEDGQVALTN